jgi:serine/threonine-protein kinase
MLRPRQALGKYRVIRRIAEGGFAEVYEARDTIEGVRVAVKVPHPHLIDKDSLRDFRHEVELTSRLDHPNILPIKTADFIDGTFVIVYPLGIETLDDRLARRLPVGMAALYARQILSAVAYAHERRIIHCDIKPENIILFPEDRLRLTDFGISRVALRTLSGSGSGTIGYLAPEQALGKASFRSDVFSLGLVLYELLAGDVPSWPFDWPPPGFERASRKAHPDYLALLQRALAVDQYARFDDAAHMREVFEKLRRTRRLVGRPARRRSRARTTTRDWKAIREQEFQRRYKQLLGAQHPCGRCKGPVSEPMLRCPWCGAELRKWRGPTRCPERCPRCKRGRKLDWRFCGACHGPGFRRVAEREYTDARYAGRCAAPRCKRRVLMPFQRYCPWCRARVARRWPWPGGRPCAGCGWGVARDFWDFCAWCGKSQGRKVRRG